MQRKNYTNLIFPSIFHKMSVLLTIMGVIQNQIDSEQFQKILKYIRSGVESGATLETGGDRFGNSGFYVQPTVFSNVKV